MPRFHRPYTTTYWTDAAFNDRFDEGFTEALRYAHLPEWLIRLLLASRRVRLRRAKRLAGSSGG
jgi:hypothetical protein